MPSGASRLGAFALALLKIKGIKMGGSSGFGASHLDAFALEKSKRGQEQARWHRRS